VAVKVGLRINEDKTKLMKVKTVSPQRVVLTKGPAEEMEEVTYLGSVVSITGGTDQDVEARLGQARLAFRAMDKLLTSQIFGRATKVKIFNSSVKTVLLYASESWTVTQRTVFINKCPNRILNIRWPDRITDKELWKKTGGESVLDQL